MNEMDTANLSFIMGYDEAKSFTSGLFSTHSKDAYLAEVNRSLSGVLGYIYNTSRFSDRNQEANDKLQIKLDIKEDLVANCECYLPEDNDHELTISITTGILHALNDLTARALSSGNFMNERLFSNTNRETSRWNGCECFAAVPLHPPRHRYFDYSQENTASIEARAFYYDVERDIGIPPGSLKPSYIGTFYKKVPNDNDRMDLGLLLIDVALFWIFMHEEAHYREGHMFYQEDMPFNGMSATVNKVLEAQADAIATEEAFKRFFKPDIIQDFNSSWIQGHNGLFRIVAGGISLAISILDRKNRIIGKDNNYPNPRTRFALALKKIMSEGAKKVDKGHSVDIKNNLIFVTPSPEFQEICAEWLHGAFNDFYTISEIIAEEEDVNPSFDMELLVEDIECVVHVSFIEFMFSHPDMRKIKDEEYLNFNRELSLSEKQKYHMDRVISEFGNWDELHEIIHAHNKVYADEARRYQTETLGSLRNVVED
ncbi:MAG: hypothetical protein ACRBDL_08815 [Alphaproteobacteria bacterium]